LNEEQLISLSMQLDRLYNHFENYQDVEFSFIGDRLYILQSRPITSHITLPDSNGVRIVWDNSNIIESYPGLTQPLTFSFILKMYEAVYVQLSIVMGIAPKKVEANKEVYANMLGLIHGRVYYNLNAWYGALQLLPGYNLNAAFMEKMMGVKESFANHKELPKATWRDYADIVRAIYGILKNLITIDKQRKEFQAYFNEVMQTYEAKDLLAMSPEDLIAAYLEFEQTLVKKWKAPLVNDFFAMIYFGLLQKLCQKWVASHPHLHNDLVSGSADVISTQPAEWSLKIAGNIRAQQDCFELFTKHNEYHIWKELQLGAFPDIYQSIQKYIKAWGDRCVGELKLETITYHQQPQLYIKILKSYLKSTTQQKGSTTNNHRTDAEALMMKTLSGKPIKKWLFKHVLNKARYLVSNRENLRYERTRGFGMVRHLFSALGIKLYAEQKLEDSKDIFWLTQEEVFGFVKGTGVTVDLKALVELRKKEYTQFETLIPDERIETFGGVFIGNAMNQPKKENRTNQTGEYSLTGIGCSAGRVKARVQIITHPSEVTGLDGDILVTSSTDPGWVPLFPTCSAILVERGSLLSHSAIVSREMGIPCIVGITGLLSTLKTGDWIEMDGSEGWVKIIDPNS
ncbi:MAG: phosphoenolpyruvate synthase, partial [Bacteroidetes bacterium]|nr:phosphoenolpyruvate synthase [Bacteroidota bacterium]